MFVADSIIKIYLSENLLVSYVYMSVDIFPPTPNSSKKMGGLSLFLICPRQSVFCLSKRQHLYILKNFKLSGI